MKVTVLMENTAPEGCGLVPEHGLSLYIEHRGKRLLLDAGSSGRFADNACTLGVDLAAVELARRLEGMEPVNFPRETAMGALALYISDQSVVNFQPMNINFGLIPQLGYRVKGKRNKNAKLAERALEKLEELDL